MMTDDTERVTEMRVGRKEKKLAGRDYTIKVARMKNCDEINRFQRTGE